MLQVRAVGSLKVEDLLKGPCPEYPFWIERGLDFSGKRFADN